MNAFPLLLAIYAGFTHAFEADHLLAVSNIVSRRNNTRTSMKDGIFWGLGHTSTIVLIGIFVLLFRMNISAANFRYLEALVGVMMIILGIYRLRKLLPGAGIVVHKHSHDYGPDGHHEHLHMHIGDTVRHSHPHSLAYSVGLVHGLAGSGALILMVMFQIEGAVNGLVYVILFGLGSVAGMGFAAGLFSVPFSRRIIESKNLQATLVIISSILCLGYGSFVVYNNLV